jgi:hypothetical protein
MPAKAGFFIATLLRKNKTTSAVTGFQTIRNKVFAEQESGYNPHQI